MAGLNKVILIGNLGRDPEMRFTASGSPVTSFTMAVSRSYKSQDGEQREETDWFSVDCWNRLAEIANEYLQKGRQVYIEGRVRLDTWDDRNTGEKRSRLKVTASDLRLLGQRGDQAGGEFGDRSSDVTESAELDNMPF
jgi:single-strand DNA-binding protein